MKKIILLLLALMLLVGVVSAFSMVASAETAEPQMSIAYCNLSFRDTVCIKYAVASNVSDVKILIWTEPQTDYTVGTHNSEITSYYTENIGGAPHMVFDYTALSAKQMTDVVYARAYAKVDGVDYYSDVNAYSILQYAYNKLATSTNMKLSALLINMLSYGATAQQYFDYKTDRLPTATWYQIKVTAGQLGDGNTSGLYLPGDKVTLIAPETDAEGKGFSCWVDGNGNKIATTATYEHTVGTANAVYTPMYKHTDMDDAAALQAAVLVYIVKLQEMKIDFELNKADYLAEDYEAVVTAIANAITAIADAETVEGVEKIFNDAKAVYDTTKAGYDTKAPVITKLIGYYNAVRNAITVDSKALIEEIDVYVNGNATTPSFVDTVYPILPPAVTAYKNGDKNLDGTDVTVNLVTELNAAIAAYNYLVNPTAGLKADATAATNAIKAIGTVKFGISDAAIANARTAYNDFAAKVTGRTGVAAYLADSNIDMVENLAVLTDAEAKIQNLKFADVMYLTLGGNKNVSVFKDYIALGTKVDFEKKAVYDTINAALGNWATTYAVDVDNAKLIIDAVEGAGFYATYLANNDMVNLFAAANTEFASIAARIGALNKVTVLTPAAYNEYVDITKAIEAWKVVRADDTTTTTVNEKVVIDNYNFVRVLAANGLVLTSDVTAPAGSTLPVVDMADIANSLTAKDITKADNYFGLYDFPDTVTETFFTTTCANAVAAARTLNASIKTLKDNLTAGIRYTSIERHIALEGVYAMDAITGNYVKVAADATKPALSIANYMAAYVTTEYDLSSLLNLADFEVAKNGAIERIAGYKTGAENIEKLIAAIDFTKVKAGADEFSYVKFVEGTDAEADAIYYVNLLDADAVAAANEAYTEWVAYGANSNIREWVQVKDANGEVVADTYTFVPVVAGDVDADALAALKQMNDDIVILKDMAKKVIAHFELVAEVWNEVAAKVDLTDEANTADVKVLTLSNAVLSAGVDSISKKALAIPVVLSSSSAKSFVVGGKTYSLAAKGAVTLADSVTGAADLQSLIDAGNNAYEAFMVKNRALTIGTSVTAAYEKYIYVEHAVKLIAAAELVMVKDVFADAIANAYTANTITAGQKETFTEWVLGATAIKGYIGNTIRAYAPHILANGGISVANIERGARITANKTADKIYEGPSGGNLNG